MKFQTATTLAALTMMWAVACPFALADDAAAPSPDYVKAVNERIDAVVDIAYDFGEKWYDPAFNQYIDYPSLIKAVGEGDSSLLTDAALQFMEGERILLRSHKAIAADAMFQRAVKLAAEKKDTDSLTRLESAAAASHKKKLSALVKNAKQLAEASRAVPDIAIPLSTMLTLTEDQLGTIQYIVRLCDRALVTGNKSSLNDAEKAFAGIEIAKAARTPVMKLIAATKTDMPEKQDKASESLSALDKLSEATRQVRTTSTSSSQGSSWNTSFGWQQDASGRTTVKANAKSNFWANQNSSVKTADRYGNQTINQQSSGIAGGNSLDYNSTVGPYGSRTANVSTNQHLVKNQSSTVGGRDAYGNVNVTQKNSTQGFQRGNQFGGRYNALTGQNTTVQSQSGTNFSNNNARNLQGNMFGANQQDRNIINSIFRP